MTQTQKSTIIAKLLEAVRPKEEHSKILRDWADLEVPIRVARAAKKWARAKDGEDAKVLMEEGGSGFFEQLDVNPITLVAKGQVVFSTTQS